MFKVTKYPVGTFSWADISSTDAAASKKFYSELMGWTIDDLPMGNGQDYTMFAKDGETVCGLGPMQDTMKDQGIPSFWASYVTVDNVDAYVPKIKELGGQVIMEPMDIFDSGRMLVFSDPEGTALSLWQPVNHIGASLVNTAGAMAWNELSTRNPAQAMEFYGKLFGWEFNKMDGMEYYTIANNGRMNGGVMQITEQMGAMPSNWGVYFSVADIDQSVAKVPELGGKVLGPIMDAMNMRMAVIADPTGAICSIIEAEPDPWIE